MAGSRDRSAIFLTDEIMAMLLPAVGEIVIALTTVTEKERFDIFIITTIT